MASHKDKLPDDERIRRRKESAKRYRDNNREKCIAAALESRAKNTEKYKAVQVEYRAREAEKIKAVSDAYREKNREEINRKTREWQLANIEKLRAYQASYRSLNYEKELSRKIAWIAKNPDAEKARLAEWAKRNPEKRRLNEISRRAAKKSSHGKLSADIAGRLKTLQKGKCACCKSDLSESGFHLDHIIPLARGGENLDSNIQLLCPPCNLSKHDKHPVDFMQRRGFLL